MKGELRTSKITLIIGRGFCYIRPLYEQGSTVVYFSFKLDQTIKFFYWQLKQKSQILTSSFLHSVEKDAPNPE